MSPGPAAKPKAQIAVTAQDGWYWCANCSHRLERVEDPETLAKRAAYEAAGE